VNDLRKIIEAVINNHVVLPDPGHGRAGGVGAAYPKTTCGGAPANRTKPARRMCCQFVAALLPVLLPLKCLPDKRVTDVATLRSAFSDAEAPE
jgi:hypothetical protein